ncbi:hypothetical protein MK805_15365 [Shimazuella sp. AN120528]|uniref:hypothetical protein n=1 Tax=Shimazuella soli TaxID=1892854 RepID=UPI001F0D2CA8|nr:hypothetical protein [Shimazuella soli]MCH5586321.1 hypothetical protein [Shimazuella soli]
MAFQVVLYDEEGVILDVFSALEKIIVEENNISWAGGGLVDVQSSFLILDESISVGGTGSVLESSLKNLDQKKNLKSDISRLQTDIQANQDAINFLLGL